MGISIRGFILELGFLGLKGFRSGRGQNPCSSLGSGVIRPGLAVGVTTASSNSRGCLCKALSFLRFFSLGGGVLGLAGDLVLGRGFW